MTDAGILIQVADDRIHGNYIFRIIILYGGKVPEFPFDSILGIKKIGDLHIYDVGISCGDEIHLPYA